ncbi:MAG: hypothetical protein ACRDTA_23605 [Pseudonocardiaceae bacterium]
MGIDFGEAASSPTHPGPVTSLRIVAELSGVRRTLGRHANRTWGIRFGGLIRAAAAGAYLGAAVAGLIAVLTGQAFAAGSPWLAGAPVLALFGAVGGWFLARLTRARLVPRLPRRTLVFTVGGLVSLPLAVAIGQLHQVGNVGIALVMIAGCAGIVSYVTGRLRRASQRVGGRYVRAAQ